MIVIGGGIAGSLFAYRLVSRGLSVLILEAGPRYSPYLAKQTRLRPDNIVQQWQLPKRHPATIVYDDQSSIPYPLSSSVVKAVGGTTLAWLGTSLRMHPDDLKMKSKHGVGDDWPLSYNELAPYYLEAEKELGVAGADDNPWLPRDEPFPLPAFEFSIADSIYQKACSALGIGVHSTPQARNSIEYQLRPKCENHASCIPFCPSGAKYTATHHIELAEETGRLKVRHNSPVVKLNSDGDRVKSVLCFQDGNLVEFAADTYALCAHTVETTRLLLLSSSDAKSNGLANSSGLLGKFFMDHPLIVAEGLVDRMFTPKGYQTLQSYQFYPDTNRAHAAAFKLEFSTSPQFSWETRNSNSGKSSWLKIVALFEMLPTLTNSISLSTDKKDRLGLAASSLRIELGEYEWNSVQRATEICVSILRQAGARNIAVSDPFWGAAHPSGTCRMGTSSENSIVDHNLRTHDFKNLYIVGSGVFPTVGAANPTLTIAALALKTADSL